MHNTRAGFPEPARQAEFEAGFPHAPTPDQVCLIPRLEGQTVAAHPRFGDTPADSAGSKARSMQAAAFEAVRADMCDSLVRSPVLGPLRTSARIECSTHGWLVGAHGPARVRGRGVRQDRGGTSCHLPLRVCRQAGGAPSADNCLGGAALPHAPVALRDARRGACDAFALRLIEGEKGSGASAPRLGAAPSLVSDAKTKMRIGPLRETDKGAATADCTAKCGGAAACCRHACATLGQDIAAEPRAACC